MNIWDVRKWPLIWRRAFILTLPISGPLWAITQVVAVFMTIIVMIFIILPIEFWREVLRPLWSDGEEKGTPHETD